MIENQLKSLSTQQILELFNEFLSSRDEISEYRRSGLRVAKFVHYADEPAFHELVAVADWRGIDDPVAFSRHFSQELVQSGTCDNCHSEVVSYAKSARCPVCDANVECT
jgi:hypothetical protein